MPGEAARGRHHAQRGAALSAPRFRDVRQHHAAPCGLRLAVRREAVSARGRGDRVHGAVRVEVALRRRDPGASAQPLWRDARAPERGGSATTGVDASRRIEAARQALRARAARRVADRQALQQARAAGTPLDRRMSARRILVIASVAVACAWTGLVLAYGGLHFDDFVNIGESRGALALTVDEWMKPAADGRWQPLKRLTFDALGRTAGLTFWPYALALAGAHLIMAAGTWSAARAVWRDRDLALSAGLIALASLNLSAYSVGNVGSLQGILCIALGMWSVALALQAAFAPRGRAALLTLSALLTLAACWYKESAVTTPALACFGVWLASRARRIHPAEALRAVAAPSAGVVLCLAARLVLDVPLIPSQSRYTLGGSWPLVRNAMIVAANVLPWAVVALLASGAIRERRRGALGDLAVMTAAALAVALPSLLLPWTSPNFWYAAVPVAALGTTGFLRRAARPRRAAAALALTMILALAGVSAAAFAAGVHRWGPYSEA